MKRIPVVSSNLKSVGYDDDTEIFEAEFQNERIYRYYGVPKTINTLFWTVPDKGYFFRTIIAAGYRYEEIKN
jgi:hypothetical protein